MILLRLRRWLLLILLACGAASVWAGNIHFGLERTGNKLVLINQGNSTAFFPVVLRLLADGSWQPLPPLQNGAGQLPAKGRLEFAWRESVAPDPFATALPLMVRFFDEAGSGFGQISFFNQPLAVAPWANAAYQRGQLVIQPPAERGAPVNWLIWAQEEGISPLAGTVRFEHVQPQARRIEWSKVTEPLRFDLGGGRPPAILLRPTAGGWEMQPVMGGQRGTEQRAAWLDAGRLLYLLAGLAAAAGLALGGGQWLRHRRKTI